MEKTMEQKIRDYIAKNVFHYNPVFIVSSSKPDGDPNEETQIINDPSRKAYWFDQTTPKIQYFVYDVMVKAIIKKVLP